MHIFIRHSICVAIAVAVAVLGMGWAEGFSSGSMHRVLLGCLILGITEFAFLFAYYKYEFSWTPIIGLLVTASWGWVGFEILTANNVFLIVKILWFILFLSPGVALVSFALEEDEERWKWKERELRSELEARRTCGGGGRGGWGEGGISSDSSFYN